MEVRERVTEDLGVAVEARKMAVQAGQGRVVVEAEVEKVKVEVAVLIGGHDMIETEEDTEAPADMIGAETMAAIGINMEVTLVVAVAAAAVANLK